MHGFSFANAEAVEIHLQVPWVQPDASHGIGTNDKVKVRPRKIWWPLRDQGHSPGELALPGPQMERPATTAGPTANACSEAALPKSRLRSTRKASIKGQFRLCGGPSGSVRALLSGRPDCGQINGVPPLPGSMDCRLKFDQPASAWSLGTGWDGRQLPF